MMGHRATEVLVLRFFFDIHHTSLRVRITVLVYNDMIRKTDFSIRVTEVTYILTDGNKYIRVSYVWWKYGTFSLPSALLRNVTASQTSRPYRSCANI